jgi:class 3 adenylate cyclase
VCITRYEGYVFQKLGDGIVAFFGDPLAHEDKAERVIHAGLAIIEADPWSERHPLRLLDVIQ